MKPALRTSPSGGGRVIYQIFSLIFGEEGRVFNLPLLPVVITMVFCELLAQNILI